MRYGGLTDQRKASTRRRADAKALREASRWRGAMYLLGYAVECSLKAKLMERYGLRDLSGLQAYLRRRQGQKIDVFTHSLHELMEWTQSERRMDNETKRRWGVLSKWSVHWRYSPLEGSEKECNDFFQAEAKVCEFIMTSV